MKWPSGMALGREEGGGRRGESGRKKKKFVEMTGDNDSVCPQRRPLHHPSSVLNNKSGSIIFIKAVQSASAQGHQT